ncbi:MAG: NAD-dependent epimerase/dehydratase family protein [Candidatus Omnitrophota bacterium]
MKSVALLTLVAFISTQAFIPAPVTLAKTSDPVVQVANAGFTIPSELGKIEEVYLEPRATTHDPRNLARGSWPVAPKTVVFIQDAHDSLEAQENIAKIIDHLVKEKGVKTVFEEGYEGPVPTDKFFGFIKDPAVKQKVSYFLLDKLRIGGAEYAHINRATSQEPRATEKLVRGTGDVDRGTNWQLIGVDDLKLYSENIGAYQRASVNRQGTEEDLRELFSQITILANQYFPRELKTLLKAKERFGERKLPLLDYLRDLQKIYFESFDLTPSPLSSPPARGRGEGEGKMFSEEYPATSLLLTAEKSKDKKLIKQLNALDSKVVFEEMMRLEKDVSGAFLTNERDQRIFAYYQGLELLKRLNRIEVTQDEYAALRAEGIGWRMADSVNAGLAPSSIRPPPSSFFHTQGMADFIVSQTHKSLVLSKSWEQHIQDAVRFYDIARSRDRSLAKALDHYLWGDTIHEPGATKKDKRGAWSVDRGAETAILVYGGFHANAIKEILKEQGVSYVVISPRITSISKKHQDYYKQLMSVGHHSFETPFLVARANKPPGIFHAAVASGEASAVRSELRALTSSVEALGDHAEPSLIERHLGSIDQRQSVRSEMRQMTAHLAVSNNMLQHGYDNQYLPRIYELGQKLVAYVNARQIYDAKREMYHVLKDDRDLLGEGPFDAMMVFGSGYLDVPKEAARVALELRKQNPDMKVIVVGNYGKDQQMAGNYEVDGKRVSEAEYFAKAMGDLGVRPDFMGKSSTNTTTNVLESREVVDTLRLSPKRVIIASILHRRAGPTFTLHYPLGNESLASLGIEKVGIWSPEINLNEWDPAEAIAAIKDAAEEVRKIQQYSLQTKPRGITPTTMPSEILDISSEVRLLLNMDHSIKDMAVIRQLEKLMKTSKNEAIREAAGRKIVEEVLGDEYEALRLEAFAAILPGIIARTEFPRPSEREVDLHTHSYRSDAYDTPTAYILHAFEEGLRGVALTDHNYLPGEETSRAAKILNEKIEKINSKTGMKVPSFTLIPGIEVTTFFGGPEVHLLLYMPSFFETREGAERPVLERFTQKLKEARAVNGPRAERIMYWINEHHPEFSLTLEELNAIYRYEKYNSGVGDAIWEKYKDDPAGKVALERYNIKSGKDVWYNFIVPYVPVHSLTEEERRLYPQLNETLEFARAMGAKIAVAHPNEIIEQEEGVFESLMQELSKAAREGRLSAENLLGVELVSHKLARSRHKDFVLQQIKNLNTEDPYYSAHPLLSVSGSDSHGLMSWPSNPLGRFVKNSVADASALPGFSHLLDIILQPISSTRSEMRGSEARDSDASGLTMKELLDARYLDLELMPGLPFYLAGIPNQFDIGEVLKVQKIVKRMRGRPLIGFFVQTDQGEFFIKKLRQSDSSPMRQADASFFEKYIMLLQQADIPVPLIPKQATQHYLFPVQDPEARGIVFYTVEKRVLGRPIFRNEASLENLRAASSMLARIHDASKNWKPWTFWFHQYDLRKVVLSSQGLYSRKEFIEKARRILAPEDYAMLHVVMTQSVPRLLKTMKKLKKIPIPSDFNLTNMIFNPTGQEVIGVFDLVQARMAYRFEDFLPLMMFGARKLNWVVSNLKQETLEAVQVYQKTASEPLSSDEIDVIPDFFFFQTAYPVLRWLENARENQLQQPIYLKALDALREMGRGSFGIFLRDEIIPLSSAVSNFRSEMRNIELTGSEGDTIGSDQFESYFERSWRENAFVQAQKEKIPERVTKGKFDLALDPASQGKPNAQGLKPNRPVDLNRFYFRKIQKFLDERGILARLETLTRKYFMVAPQELTVPFHTLMIADDETVRPNILTTEDLEVSLALSEKNPGMKFLQNTEWYTAEQLHIHVTTENLPFEKLLPRAGLIGKDEGVSLLQASEWPLSHVVFQDDDLQKLAGSAMKLIRNLQTDQIPHWTVVLKGKVVVFMGKPNTPIGEVGAILGENHTVHVLEAAGIVTVMPEKKDLTEAQIDQAFRAASLDPVEVEQLLLKAGFSKRSEARSGADDYVEKQRAFYETTRNNREKLWAQGRIPQPRHNYRVLNISLDAGYGEVSGALSDFPPELVDALDGVAREIKMKFPQFKVTGRGQFHATLFDVAQSALSDDQSDPKQLSLELRDLLKKITRIRGAFKPFRVHLKGIDNGPAGSIVVNGFVEGNSLGDLRTQWSGLIPDRERWANEMSFHITVARLERPMGKDVLDKFLDWIRERRDMDFPSFEVHKPVFVATADNDGTQVNPDVQRELSIYNSRSETRREVQPKELPTVGLAQFLASDFKGPVIIGGTGMIGAHLIEKLAREGRQVAVPIRAGISAEHAKNLLGVVAALGKDGLAERVVFVDTGDSLDPMRMDERGASYELLKQLLGKSTVVYHLAAQTHVRPNKARGETYESFAVRTYVLNVFYTKLIARVAKELKLPMVYSSSQEVFSLNQLFQKPMATPVTEKMPIPFHPVTKAFMAEIQRAFDDYVAQYVAGAAQMSPLEFTKDLLNKPLVQRLDEGDKWESLIEAVNLLDEQYYPAKAEEGNKPATQQPKVTQALKAIGERFPLDLLFGNYAISKLLAEKDVLELAQAWAFRFVNVYGEGMHPNVISFYLNHLEKNRERVGRGESPRGIHFTDHARDFMAATELAGVLSGVLGVLEGEEKRHSEVVHVGTGHVYTMLEVLKNVAAFVGVDLPDLEDHGDQPLKMMTPSDYDVLQKHLPGTQPEMTLEEGLRAAVERNRSEVRQAGATEIGAMLKSPMILMERNLTQSWLWLVRNKKILTTTKDPGTGQDIEYGVRISKDRESVEQFATDLAMGEDLQDVVLEKRVGPFIANFIWNRSLRPGPFVLQSLEERRQRFKAPHDPNTCSFDAGVLALKNRPEVARITAQDHRIWQVYQNVSPIDERGGYLLIPDLSKPGNLREQRLTKEDISDLTEMSFNSSGLTIYFEGAMSGASQNHIHAKVYPGTVELGEGFVAVRDAEGRVLAEQFSREFPGLRLDADAKDSEAFVTRWSAPTVKVLSQALSAVLPELDKAGLPFSVAWSGKSAWLVVREPGMDVLPELPGETWGSYQLINRIFSMEFLKNYDALTEAGIRNAMNRTIRSRPETIGFFAKTLEARRSDPPLQSEGRIRPDAKNRAEMRDVWGKATKGNAEAWVIRDSRTGAEKGLAYQTPLLPKGNKNSDAAWRDFNEMVFEFPKLLEHAAQKKLPVVLVIPEKLDGFGPLAEEAPWIEGARTALAWASAYFRFKELGNVDVRVLQLPAVNVPQAPIAMAVKKLLSKDVRVEGGTPESQMEARMFRLADALTIIPSRKPELSLESRAIALIAGTEQSDAAREMIRPDLPPIPAGKKRIVVTGAAGFIGINLVKRLLAEGHQVIALDDLITANKDFSSFFQKEPDLYFKKWDVSKPFDIEGPVDQVIHLASLASPPDYYVRPLETLRSGLLATREMVELALSKNARFLFTSTSEVYGDAKVHPQAETYEGNVSSFLKRSQYDQSKRGAETLIKLYAAKYAEKGPDFRIARPFNTYGPFMRLDDGRAVTNFIGKVLTGQPIEIYGNRSITRSFGYVDDTVDGLLKLLRTDKLTSATPIQDRVFNIGNDGEFTLGELADLVNELGKKHLNRTVPVHVVGAIDPSDPVKRQPDLTRARTILDYAPSVPLREGLEKTFLYFLNARSEARLVPAVFDLAQRVPTKFWDRPIAIDLISDNTGTLTLHLGRPLSDAIHDKLMDLLSYNANRVIIGTGVDARSVVESNDANRLIVNTGDDAHSVVRSQQSLIGHLVQTGVTHRWFITSAGGTIVSALHKNGELHSSPLVAAWPVPMKGRLATSMAHAFYDQLKALLKAGKIPDVPLTESQIEVSRADAMKAIQRKLRHWKKIPDGESKNVVVYLLPQLFGRNAFIYDSGAKMAIDTVMASRTYPWLGHDFFYEAAQSVKKDMAGTKERLEFIPGLDFLDVSALTKLDGVEAIRHRYPAKREKDLLLTVAIGDGLNDLPVLNHDFAAPDKPEVDLSVALSHHKAFSLRVADHVLISNGEKMDGAAEVLAWLNKIQGKTVRQLIAEQQAQLHLQAWQRSDDTPKRSDLPTKQDGSVPGKARAEIRDIAKVGMHPYQEFVEGIRQGKVTFAMIKRDGLLIKDKIIEKFREAGFEVYVANPVRLDERTVREFYKIHQERSNFEGLVQYMTSGEVIPILLVRSSNDAAQLFNEKKKTIRKELQDTYQLPTTQDFGGHTIQLSVFHASDPSDEPLRQPHDGKKQVQFESELIASHLEFSGPVADSTAFRSELRNLVSSGTGAESSERQIVVPNSELNTPGSSKVLGEGADAIVRAIRKNVQPAMWFVDADDLGSLSPAQKRECFYVAFSNKAVRTIVYNEHGQVRDKQWVEFLKSDRVTRTDQDLSRALAVFGKTNMPTIHLSKEVQPTSAVVRSLGKRVMFFKQHGEKGGTLAVALLWAISGAEKARLAGVSLEKDGFWTVAETLLTGIQKAYESSLVFAIAA